MKIRTTKIFDDWLFNLKSNRAKAVISRRLEGLEKGNYCNVKSLGQKVFELKINIESGYRLYFCNTGKEIILLLCGGDKSSQQKDIKKAKELMQGV